MLQLASIVRHVCVVGASLAIACSTHAQLIFSTVNPPSRGINVATLPGYGGGLTIPTSTFADFDAERYGTFGTPNTSGELPFVYVSQRSILRSDRIEASSILRAARPLGTAFFPNIAAVSGGSNIGVYFTVTETQPFTVYYDDVLRVGGQTRSSVGMLLFDQTTSTGVFGMSEFTPTPSGPIFGTLLPGRSYYLSYGAATVDITPPESPLDARIAFRFIVPSPSALAVISCAGVPAVARRRRCNRCACTWRSA